MWALLGEMTINLKVKVKKISKKLKCLQFSEWITSLLQKKIVITKTKTRLPGYKYICQSASAQKVKSAIKNYWNERKTLQDLRLGHWYVILS